ncbi:MAG: hypothetical protein WCV84_04180 [Patescibacteria group bacterium]
MLTPSTVFTAEQLREIARLCNMRNVADTELYAVFHKVARERAADETCDWVMVADMRSGKVESVPMFPNIPARAFGEVCILPIEGKALVLDLERLPGELIMTPRMKTHSKSPLDPPLCLMVVHEETYDKIPVLHEGELRTLDGGRFALLRLRHGHRPTLDEQTRFLTEAREHDRKFRASLPQTPRLPPRVP